MGAGRVQARAARSARWLGVPRPRQDAGPHPLQRQRRIHRWRPDL